MLVPGHDEQGPAVPHRELARAVVNGPLDRYESTVDSRFAIRVSCQAVRRIIAQVIIPHGLMQSAQSTIGRLRYLVLRLG